VETSLLKKIFTHLVPYDCRLSYPGLSFRPKLTCPQGCSHTLSGTEGYSPPAPASAEILPKSPPVSTSRVANQLIFALSTINCSTGDYDRFCHALTLDAGSSTYYENFRTLSLKQFGKVWEQQEPVYQAFCQQIGATDLQMDGSYSQRRNAEHCFVTLLDGKYQFVVQSNVGSKKELHMSSQALEPELCARAVAAISVSPLKPTSITHDDHTAVNKLMEVNLPQLPGCAEYHDSWHRRRNVAKYLPQELDKAKLPKTEADDVVRKVLMLLGSAYHSFAGDRDGFQGALDAIPTYFSGQSPLLRGVIKGYLDSAYPKETLHMYISKNNTSCLEGFHGHHHQLIGKCTLYHKYRERTYLHNLIWNQARLEDYKWKCPLHNIPVALFQGHDWLRRAQANLKLIVLAPEPASVVSKRVNRRRTVEQKRIERKEEKKRRNVSQTMNALMSQNVHGWE